MGAFVNVPLYINISIYTNHNKAIFIIISICAVFDIFYSYIYVNFIYSTYIYTDTCIYTNRVCVRQR